LSGASSGRPASWRTRCVGKDQRADLLEVEAGDHRVLHIGRAGAMIFARSGPTLTKVPVASLKSSAMRPSNVRPW
jgi:hypothetical protein